MLFKLVPLLLSSLFFSYVAGITGQDGWDEMFDPWPEGVAIKQEDIFQMTGGITIVTLPLSNRLTFHHMLPTDQVEEGLVKSYSIVDLRNIGDSTLWKYSVIVNNMPLSPTPVKIMKKEFADMVHRLIKGYIYNNGNKGFIIPSYPPEPVGLLSDGIGRMRLGQTYPPEPVGLLSDGIGRMRLGPTPPSPPPESSRMLKRKRYLATEGL